MFNVILIWTLVLMTVLMMMMMEGVILSAVERSRVAWAGEAVIHGACIDHACRDHSIASGAHTHISIRMYARLVADLTGSTGATNVSTSAFLTVTVPMSTTVAPRDTFLPPLTADVMAVGASATDAISHTGVRERIQRAETPLGRLIATGVAASNTAVNGCRAAITDTADIDTTGAVVTIMVVMILTEITVISTLAMTVVPTVVVM